MNLTKKTRAHHITRENIVPDDIMDSVSDDSAGAVVLFLGTVRDNSEAGDVDKVVYEAYESMAENRLGQIEDEVKRIWPVKKAKVVHRVGTLGLGDVSVAVAVSAVHRAEAFDACRHAIERIKHDVPIWKKERLAGGKDVWVEGQSMRPRMRLEQQR